MDLRVLRPDDWPAVRAIYEAGIATGNATFDTAAPDWPAWDAAHLAEHRLVARLDGRVLGWTALAPVSDRCCYVGVAEDSVYVAPRPRARGSGGRCLRRWWPRPSGAASGPCRPGSSPRTGPASACTRPAGSEWSGSASVWAGSTAAGATCCCWNAAAPPSPDADPSLTGASH